MKQVHVKIPRKAPPSPSGHVSLAEWGGYTKGDPVRVYGWSGSWTFIDFGTSITGNTWVTLYGGSRNPGGVRRFRSVDPARVSK